LGDVQLSRLAHVDWLNSGFGFETEIAGIRAFAELRAHRLFERGESSAGAVPITLGVSF
jgi:hypothetical protein